MSVYKLDPTTGCDGSARFFVEGPVFDDMAAASKVLEKEHCVLVNRVPPVEFFASWISSIKEHGQLRVDEDYNRPLLSFWLESGKHLVEFERGSRGGMVSRVEMAFYGNPSDLGELCFLWLTDVQAFGDRARELFQSRKITMHNSYQFAYKTKHETLDHIVSDAKQGSVADKECFLFYDLKKT